MTISKRKEACEKILQAGIENLYKSQDSYNLEEFSVKTLEVLMLLEREEYLKSEEGKDTIGNGTYTRRLTALSKNSLQIKIPRTRNGAFTPLTLELIQQHKEQVQDFALLLYKKGLSSRDVSETLEEYFGESMSRTTINNLAESFHEIRKKWEAKPLDKRYKVVYSDALYVSVKRNNNYSKEAVYVIYGVKEDNTRELLHLSLNPTEGV